MKKEKTKKMTVRMLIRKLRRWPLRMGVVVPGYEGGHRDIVGVKEIVKLKRNVNRESYYGPHEEDEKGQKYLVL